MSITAENRIPSEPRVIVVISQRDRTIEMSPITTIAVKQINSWNKMGADIEEHVMSFLDVRSLIQIGKASRSCKQVATNNKLWLPHFSRRFQDLQIQTALQENPDLSIKTLFGRQFSSLRLQNERALIRDAYINGRKYSIRFTALNSTLMIGAILSSIFESTDPHQKTSSIILSSCSICLSLAGAKIERDCSQGLSYIAYKGMQLVYGGLVITSGALNRIDMPITAGLFISNGSILAIKSLAEKDEIPNLCAKTSIMLKALGSGIINCGKKIFCCRSQRRLAAEL